MEDTLGTRIRKQRKRLGISQEELAKRLRKISNTAPTNVAISQWETDKNVPSGKNLHSLSQVLNLPVSWLLGVENSDVVSTGNFNGFRVPVIDINNLNTWNSQKILKKQTDNDEFLMTNGEISILSFAFRITDNAMTPEFHENDLIIIDPEIQPESGTFVLASFKDKAFFRKFQTNDTDGSFLLIPLNDDYSIITNTNSPIIIVGTMVEHRIFRRKR